MAVYVKSVPQEQMSTDALFREFGKFISDSLESLGWALQADSGDIDWATVTRETTTAWIVKGYEIRKSGTGGGTAVYMKIQYGSGYVANALGITVQMGTGFDGAGTLTGVLNTAMRIGGASGNASGIGYFTVSGDDERWAIHQGETPTPANNSVGFFQRTCDSDGTDNGTGFLLGCFGYTTTTIATNQYSSFADGAGTQDATFSWMYWPRLPAAGGAIPYFPVFMQALTNSGYVMVRDMLYCPYVFAPLHSIHVVNHFGANRTYRSVVGNTTAASQFGYTPATTMAVLMRID